MKRKMPNTLKSAIKLAESYEATIMSVYDEKRYNLMCDMIDRNIERFFNGEPVDDGLFGKVFELSTHDSNSTIVTVRSQGKCDGYALIDGKRRKLEAKTNGGRVGNLYKMNKRTRRSQYMLYCICYEVPEGKPRKDGTCKPAEWRTATVLSTIDFFVDLLEQTNATKTIGHNESDREIAIQGDSKKLYKAIRENCINFDRNHWYNDWNIL